MGRWLGAAAAALCAAAAVAVGVTFASHEAPDSGESTPVVLIDAMGNPLATQQLHDSEIDNASTGSTSLVAPEAVNPEPERRSALCQDREVTAAELNEAFDDGIDEMVGADYQRAFELADERTLWVFQDAFINDGDNDPTLAHNAGLIQEDMCFGLLVGGNKTRPQSWIAAEQTQTYDHWYWPLDGYQRDNDTFVLFLAEMTENGATYLDNATPVATWTVDIDLDDFSVGELQPAPNPDDNLYGFDVAIDNEFVYFYAQCHRQFGFSSAGHESCTSDVFIARQPISDPDRPLEYWDGEEWSRNSRNAVNIAPTTESTWV